MSNGWLFELQQKFMEEKEACIHHHIYLLQRF